jgi:peptide/nickel transport system ATP-binding protein/oligopeptide transport system ATP-binding protein
MLDRVALSEELAQRYPHEISGGQKQRANIARALVLKPRLIVCDEVVAALDVSIQADMLNLFADLQREFGLTYVFISHDLRVVAHISDRVAVMYLGRIVEQGTREEIFFGARHPYTQALLAAVPEPVPGRRRAAAPLGGDVPSPANPPAGCRFHPRCPVAIAACRGESPEARALSATHAVACHLVTA